MCQHAQAISAGSWGRLVVSKRAWYTHRWMTRLILALTSLLTHLAHVCLPEALGVWVPDSDGPRLAGDWRLDQRLYDLMQARWMGIEADARAGRRPLLDTNAQALPLFGRDGTFLGVLLYVGEVPQRGAERTLVEETVAQLAKVLGAPEVDASEVEWLVPTLPLALDGDSEEVERRYYAELLEHAGWDISRSAALLKLTRQALYDRLEALGLARFGMSDDCPDA